MMRYLPFIVISFVLYTLFFYNNQQLEQPAHERAHHGEKVVPLNFVKIAEQDKQPAPAILITSNSQAHNEVSASPATNTLKKPVTLPISTSQTLPTSVTVSSRKEDNKPTETVTKTVKTMHTAPIKKILSEEEKALRHYFKTTPASDVARLKAELYEKDFHLDLPAPPVKKHVPAKKERVTETAPDSVSSELMKSVATIIPDTPVTVLPKEKMEKPKRTFKKQVKVDQQTENNTQGLQEAIAISGNQPTYPEKAKSAKEQGTVTAKFTVNMQGKSKDISITHSSGHPVLDDAILEFIKKERFMPALKGIEKVTSEQIFTFKFELK